MMSKCERHNVDVRFNLISWFMDQAPDVNFVIKLFVREQEILQKSEVKHWMVGLMDYNIWRRSH